MATLTGNQVKDTYRSLLKLEDNNSLSADLKIIQDGIGNSTPLSISTTAISSSVNIQATGFKTPGGTSADYLRADGSVGAPATLSTTDDLTEGVTNLYDKTVALTDGTGITTSGTYPNFTITNSAPNETHTGDVTGATALTIANDVISYAKLGAEFTTSAVISASDIDFATAQVFTKTLVADTTFTFSNTGVGMVKDLVITGAFVPTFPAGSKVVAGTYNGAVSNFIQIVVVGTGDYWLSISQSL